MESFISQQYKATGIAKKQLTTRSKKKPIKKMQIKLEGFISNDGQLFISKITLVIKLIVQTKMATRATSPNRWLKTFLNMCKDNKQKA
jgi:hypothetical protein